MHICVCVHNHFTLVASSSPSSTRPSITCRVDVYTVITRPVSRVNAVRVRIVAIVVLKNDARILIFFTVRVVNFISG